MHSDSSSRVCIKASGEDDVPRFVYHSRDLLHGGKIIIRTVEVCISIAFRDRPLCIPVIP